MDTFEKRKTQVIIVGGGLTGLTLALMLERVNISYILLEAYPQLTPPLGAAIGIFANGLRIMDQLGLLDEIEATGFEPVRHEVVDAESGKKVFELQIRDLAGYMRERHGYVAATLPRHGLLQIIERHLQKRSCLLTSKRVREIEQTDARATVTCEDGSRYEAQMVVGCDGVRSTVRREMWRLAREASPGWFSKEQTMSCEYAVVFTLCPPCPAHFSPGDVVGIQGRGIYGGIICGRAGELWLQYNWRVRAPPFPADGLPRISADEQARRWADAARLPVNRGSMTFGDLMAAGMKQTGAAVLPHHAFDRWWFARCIIIGDAAHKFNPLMGQGGNNCLESAAALVNEIERCLGKGGIALEDREAVWPQEVVEEAFESVQEQRLPRVTELIGMSQVAQYVAARDHWLHVWIVRYVLPLMSYKMHADVFSGYISGGSRLKGKVWDRPDRAHSIPWGDEPQTKKDRLGHPLFLVVGLLILGSLVVGASIGIWRGLR